MNEQSNEMPDRVSNKTTTKTQNKSEVNKNWERACETCENVREYFE